MLILIWQVDFSALAIQSRCSVHRLANGFCQMYTMAHFLFHQVGGCVIFQIYPIMFCFTRSVGVWFVICIPWIIFRFTRFDGVWCVRHIPWNTLCFTRSEHVSHGIFSVLPGQQAWFVRHFPPSGQQVCDLSDGCHRVFLVSAGQGVYDLSMPMDHS